MSTPTRKATLPDTPVGSQIAWLLASAGPGNCDEAAVREHFSPEFLARAPVASVLQILEGSDWLRTAELAIHEASSHALKAAVLVDGAVRVELDAAVEEQAPHRFTGVRLNAPGPTILEVVDGAAPIAGTLDEAVHERFDSVASGLEAGGIVVGVARNGDRTVFELGADASLRYEIGSITKTFTGVLLAEMAGRGEVDFGDPAARYLPDGTSVPREESREITLEDLATHSSGLPRLPPTMSEGADPEDPYAHIGPERLYAELAGTTLDFPIGSQSVYSNYGFGLLGHCLSRAAGKPFADLVHERICAPLSLPRTEFTPKGDDLAPGYARGKPARRWSGEIIQAAGGGFESTIDDMLTYGEANADPESTSLAAAIGEAHRERLRLNERGAQALGWYRLFLKDSSIALFHNGGTAGFSSSLVCHQPTKTVVVALCNAGGTSLDPATVGLAASLVASS